MLILRQLHKSSASLRHSTVVLLMVFTAAGVVDILMRTGQVSQAAQVNAGYKDFYYGSSGTSTPTGEKAQSKLWYNDGLWWGSLYHRSTQEYRIYRFNPVSQSWTDTRTALDDRNMSRADVIWDENAQKLYVASHLFTTDATAEASSTNWARLYRYSYNTAAKNYSLDAGFPVTVSQGSCENLTIAKDSTGRLWVTYVENQQVMVNHSLDNDATWATPYPLPTFNTRTSSDDISAIIAFQGNKIGVVWSNQLSSGVYLAIHDDGAGVYTWQLETIIQGRGWADDHLNLKTDSSGQLFVAAKTGKTGTSPLIVLHVRAAAGGWSMYTFSTGIDGHTRPIVVLDESNNRVHMFATSSESGGEIYHKAADRDAIAFSPGMGDRFISDIESWRVSDASSTKQNVTNASGLLVIASNSSNKYYYHNDALAREAGTPSATPTNPPTATSTATPTLTPTLTPSNTPTKTTTQSFGPSHDTQVKAAFPFSNYSTLDHLRLRLESASEQINSYLKFDVPELGGTVIHATLRLYAYDGSNSGGSVYLVSNTYGNSSASWTETGLNWNNAPPLTGTPLSLVGAVSTNSFVDFDVTAAVTGTGTYSFGLSNTSSNSVLYYSKESALNPPQLILSIQPGGTQPDFTSGFAPPTPAQDTAALFVVGSDDRLLEQAIVETYRQQRRPFLLSYPTRRWLTVRVNPLSPSYPLSNLKKLLSLPPGLILSPAC